MLVMQEQAGRQPEGLTSLQIKAGMCLQSYTVSSSPVSNPDADRFEDIKSYFSI